MVAREQKQGINLEDVQEMNRALVIRLLRREKLCSRADLAKMTGLRQATITNIINDFIGWGLVTETGIIDGQKGRRSIGITLNTGAYRVIGIRLTRNYFVVGLFDLFGVQDRAWRETIDISLGSTVVLRAIIDNVRQVMDSSGQYTILAIGAAIPGPYVRSEGKIALMTEYPGWEMVQIEKELASSFPIPVYLEHDAKAGALAQWWLYPRHMDNETMIYVAAGQGIGAGIVIDGRLLRGTLGLAGEIGHMSIEFSGPKCECGNNGCLEHYCSSIALVREVKEGLIDHPRSLLAKNQSFPWVVHALAEGDELAHKVVKKAAWYLGMGLVSVINVFNPNTIVIGDEMAKLGDLLLDTVRSTVESHVMPRVYQSLRIELSSSENDPALVGVSMLAVERLLHKPSVIPRLLGVLEDGNRKGVEEGKETQVRSMLEKVGNLPKTEDKERHA
jgi:N-acetylglucosamine repressor